MKKILTNKTLSLLTLFTCFFVMPKAHSKVAPSRSHTVPDAVRDSDESDLTSADSVESEAPAARKEILRDDSHTVLDLYAGMGENSLNEASALTLEELKKDVRDLKINIDDAKGEVTLLGEIPLSCRYNFSVEAVRPFSETNVYVGFRVSDRTGLGRACLARFRGKTCDAIGGCVAFENLIEEDSQLFQTRFRLSPSELKRHVVTVQTRTPVKSRNLLAWADYGQVNTVRFKSKPSDDERNSSSSRLASFKGHFTKDEDHNDYANTFLGNRNRKSSRNCSENVVEQFVVVQQPTAPMMMPQQMMQQPMMAQRPPLFMPQMMPQPQMIRPFPQMLPQAPMGFRPPMPQVMPPMMPPMMAQRPPMVMPPFMNGGCAGGCIGGFRPGGIPSNPYQTLPALRYPQLNYPKNNLQVSFNANFGV
ncbi:MAG: hypothetical protein WCK43_03090 [bacterium]